MTEHLLPTTSMTSLSWISKAGFSDHTCNRKCIRIESIKCSWKVILHFFVLQRRWHRQTHTMYDICAKETPRPSFLLNPSFHSPLQVAWQTTGNNCKQVLFWLIASTSFIQGNGEVMEIYWEMLPKVLCLLTWKILLSSRSILYALKKPTFWKTT